MQKLMVHAQGLPFEGILPLPWRPWIFYSVEVNICVYQTPGRPLVTRPMDQLITSYSTGIKSHYVSGDNKIHLISTDLVTSKNILRFESSWICCSQLVHGSRDHKTMMVNMKITMYWNAHFLLFLTLNTPKILLFLFPYGIIGTWAFSTLGLFNMGHGDFTNNSWHFQ